MDPLLETPIFSTRLIFYFTTNAPFDDNIMTRGEYNLYNQTIIEILKKSCSYKNIVIDESLKIWKRGLSFKQFK